MQKLPKKFLLSGSLIFCILTVLVPELSAHSKEYYRRKIAEAKAKEAEAKALRAIEQAERAREKEEVDKQIRQEKEKRAAEAKLQKEKSIDWDKRMLDAVEKGDDALYRDAIRHGAKVHAQRTGYRGDTALHLAVRQNNMNFVKMLVEEKKMDVEFQNYSLETPLYLACMTGRHEIAAYLLKKHADPDKICTGGLRPIQIAVRQDQIKCVQVLVQYRATLSPKLLQAARSDEMKEYLSSLKIQPESAGKKKP